MKNVNGVWLPTVTDQHILGFFGEYRWMSNFHPLPQQIVVDGVPFWTSEAAYMAGKTTDEEIIRQLSELSPEHGNKAKKIGRNLKLRNDWSEMRDDHMLEVLVKKFCIHELADALIATGSRYLEETNYWHDQYWGVCNGTGHNKLGHLLMKIRNILVYT